MIDLLRRALLAVWDFVVGDDPRTAAGVVAALGITGLIAHAANMAAWWVMPVAVAGLLVMSLRRAAAR